MKIFIAIPNDKGGNTFITDRAVKAFLQYGEVVKNPLDRTLTLEEFGEMAGDAEVLVIGWGAPRLNDEYLNKMQKLKLIAYMGGSVAGIVCDEIYKRNIVLTSGNNVFAKSVAEGCLTYTLVALRKLEYYMKLVRDGKWWNENSFNNRGLIGKKVGLVGFGAISKYYAELLRWFDVELLISSSYLSDEEAVTYNAREANNEEIFSTCDVISIHSSFNEKTKGMITRELMNRLKPNALLVNTARGPIADEEAMVELLQQGRFCAALDVFSEEPIPLEGHFLSPLLKLSNVVLIPHMGGPTLDMREQVALELAKDLGRFLKGEQLLHEAKKIN